MLYPIKNHHHDFRLLSIQDIFKWIHDYPLDTYYKKMNNEWIEIYKPFVLHTLFICHRINTIQELNDIPDCFGIEIDIRENQISNTLMLAHDPYQKGIFLKDFLEFYKHSCLIANIKSERIEMECLDLFQKYNVFNYFFLDSTFPMMVYLLNSLKNKNFAVRYSEYETLPLIESDWVWIDCFSIFPLDSDLYTHMKSDLHKKICIVSPELQHHDQDISLYRFIMMKDKILPDAICCKKTNIYEWI